MAGNGKKSSAQLNREIDEALRRGKARRAARSCGSGVSETKQTLLRELNRKYGLAVQEPWQMLAILRGAADQLAARGERDSDRFRKVVTDHGRLREAPDSSWCVEKR